MEIPYCGGLSRQKYNVVSFPFFKLYKIIGSDSCHSPNVYGKFITKILSSPEVAEALYGDNDTFNRWLFVTVHTFAVSE